MPSKRNEYKGNPMIELSKSDDDRWPFRFGLAKAMLILENFEEICTFVKDNQEKEKSE
tara:strand:- start:1022 stop:1195 length:174 start_codon:yes stop_codon:yes gene_type:complete